MQHIFTALKVKQVCGALPLAQLLQSVYLIPVINVNIQQLQQISQLIGRCQTNYFNLWVLMSRPYRITEEVWTLTAVSWVFLCLLHQQFPKWDNTFDWNLNLIANGTIFRLYYFILDSMFTFIIVTSGYVIVPVELICSNTKLTS